MINLEIVKRYIFFLFIERFEIMNIFNIVMKKVVLNDVNSKVYNGFGC